MLRNMLKSNTLQIQDIGSRIKDLDTSLEKVREQSLNIKKMLQEPQFDIAGNIERHVKLHPIQKLLENTSDQIKELPRYANHKILNLKMKNNMDSILLFRISEMQTLHNETQTLLQEAKHALKDVVTKGISNVESKLTETRNETKDTIGALR